MNSGRSIICKKDTKMFFRRLNEFSNAKTNISQKAKDGNKSNKIKKAIRDNIFNKNKKEKCQNQIL